MNQNRKLTGKDVITIGIYSAIYFVMNFAAMMTGLIPILWILLPGTVAILTGIPFLLMVVKVPKPGAVLIMGLITAFLYFVTGQFTVLILITMLIACVVSEAYRYITKYNLKFSNLAVAFILFGYGMAGSPLALFVYRESFLAQISETMSQEYVVAISSYITTPMLILLLVSPIAGGFFGALIAGGIFKKHFKKAGIV
ncbi:hypothetical protein GCWU000282_02599 [Catonella morbi ATCC 51271]|uniref:TIGR02185 family protein n=2 Tax=Catonella TaxID=43996 RepID=V2Y0F8_9FIRM|nr:hypothetical protein GCWU000282_02599 [Catonella morbi ATCC 51271]